MRPSERGLVSSHSRKGRPRTRARWCTCTRAGALCLATLERKGILKREHIQRSVGRQTVITASGNVRTENSLVVKRLFVKRFLPRHYPLSSANPLPRGFSSKNETAFNSRSRELRYIT